MDTSLRKIMHIDQTYHNVFSVWQQAERQAGFHINLSTPKSD